MLTRKGVYPYSYMDSWDKFEETTLPPREKFYSDLTKSHISDDEFKFIHELWDTFGLKNLGELHDLYMETDVALLADIFENFREFSLKNYRLDGIMLDWWHDHHQSSSGYSKMSVSAARQKIAKNNPFVIRHDC